MNVICFKCPKCKKLSEDEAIITKCIAKHEKTELIASKKAAADKEIAVFRGYFAANLKEATPKNVAETLTAGAKLLGVEMNISLIEKTSNNYTIDQDYIQFNIIGNLNWIKGNSGAKKHKTNYYLAELYRKKTEPTLHGLLRAIEAVETYNGDYYTPNKFSCQIRVRLNEIKSLKKAKEKLLIIRAQYNRFETEHKRLTTEYLTHRKVVILKSDIKHIAIEDEAIQLRAKIQKLSGDLIKVNARLLEREKQLIEHDMPKFVKPDSSFDYDELEMLRIKQSLGYDI